MTTVIEENTVPNIPDLTLAHYRFILSHGPVDLREDAKQKLFEKIKKNKMGPFYKLMVEELQEPLDQSLYDSMTAENEQELQKFDEKAANAVQNEGETEVNEALLAKADYYAKIGDKENALSAYEALLKRSITLGTSIDIVFTLVRIGLFFGDNKLVRSNIEKLKELIEQGGDWDRRNRLKVYEGVYLMSIRDFKGAATLFLDTLSTFTSTEIFSYQDFVKYAVLTSLISMKRVDIKKRVLDASEILEVISDIPHLEDLMASLYNGKYAQFFRSLAEVEQIHLRTSRYLLPHLRYYIREMRILAYAQLLESYRSLTVTSMAQAFGVSEEYIDQDLYKFIAAGRLNCVIDKVNGIIETNRPDAKNAQYQAVIKQGDVLLNRIQKLSRVIDV
ncbi:26S proteasome subunit RPN7-domain-containing protein [Mycotypha africana]|uniref:26S proteasome subunit RPN7-domain-containing protein n=1 Tax=Mycotypha africana TaxID=64632 RepID=UPI002300D36E|nr:26S proteasome subunit RPN7-domain-containing protein [Mycotypha africana]KAI8981668.1 26S proteasome subunit RPN7-domain-containing protein [Mycotypha africana]